jgi:carboxyl-terminal processing protease
MLAACRPCFGACPDLPPRRMTDQHYTPDAISPDTGSSPAPVESTAPAWDAPPSGPPPAPVLQPVRSAGFGGGRVPASLVLVLAPVLAIVMFAGGVFAGRSGAVGASPEAVGASAGPTASASAAGLPLVDQAWTIIENNYVDPQGLDSQKMAYAAISALTDAVGDSGHTSFMTAAETKAADESLSGSFVGIGVQVGQDTAGKIQITTVFPNTPAEEAGLKRGDHIVAVDGKTTDGETVDQTVTRVRGPEGETVTLTLAREGKANFDVTITRRKFDLPLVSWAMVPGTKIAMIRLDQFATGATKAVQDAIKGAKAQGATGIVLDLRSNPGGYVSEAVGVASQFVPDGIVYQSFDRSGVRKDADIQPGGLATTMPLVVLANGDTASAAEIVTGAIQDAKRGQVVGEKTFGTGTVLGRFDLADGSTLRVGVERWLTRAGRPIWHEGLDPDVKITLATDAQPLLPDAIKDMTAVEFAKAADPQVQKAVDLLKAGG